MNPSTRVLVVTFLLLTNALLTRAATITANLSGNWNSTLTWSTLTVPTASDVVIIPNGITVTVNITTATSSTLTINTGGKLTITNGDALNVVGAVSNAGTITTNTGNLLVGGSLTNSGTLTLSSGGTLTFDGAANSTINAAAGTYSILGTIVLNMGSAATYLDVKDASFINGINGGGRFYFTLTRGTWKMDNTNTLNNMYNTGTANSLTIPYGVVIESDNGAMVLASQGTTGKVLLSGKIFMNGGQVAVQTGQATNGAQDFEYTVNGGTPQLYLSSGSLYVGAGFNAKNNTDYIDFNMTGGTMTVAFKGYSNRTTFILQDNVGGKTFMSGGLIVEQQPGNSNFADLDMGGANVASTLYSVTGGTVELGNASTTNSTAYYAIQAYPTTNYPNIDAEPGTSKTVGINNTGSVNMLSMKYNTNTLFDVASFTNVYITNSAVGYAFDGEGTMTLTSGGVTFTGAEQQIIKSTALAAITFNNLGIANTSGNVLLQVPVKVNGTLAFTSGLLDATNDYVSITNGSNAITGTTNSSYIITGNGVSTTGYLSINGLPTNTSVLFPVGTSSYYLPATINSGANTGTSYSTYVYPGVTTTGQSNGSSVSAALLAVMTDATWNISQTAGSGSATLGLNWSSSGTTLEGTYFQGFGTRIGITQFTAGAWQPTAGSGSEPAHTATTSFSSFTQFSVTGTPIALPIALADFEAAPKGKTSYLTWDAFPDGQPASFTVQRSTDGTTWNNIGVVQADATATTETAYNYTDAAPATGENYYRLFIQNADGSSSYSSVRTVAFIPTTQISVYPNPATTALTISIGSSGKPLAIRLVNTAGQVLQSRIVDAGMASLTMPTGAYPAGVYYAEIFEDGQLLQTTAVMVAH